MSQRTTQFQTITQVLLLFLVVTLFLTPSVPKFDTFEMRFHSEDNCTYTRQNNTTYTIPIGMFSCFLFDRWNVLDDYPFISVTAEIPNGTKYYANTNGQFTAYFGNMPWPEFPADTNFSATREGYKDIHWKQGEEIPDMYATKDNPDYICCTSVLLLIPITFVVILLVVGLIFVVGKIIHKLDKRNKRSKKRTIVKNTAKMRSTSSFRR